MSRCTHVRVLLVLQAACHSLALVGQPPIEREDLLNASALRPDYKPVQVSLLRTHVAAGEFPLDDVWSISWQHSRGLPGLRVRHMPTKRDVLTTCGGFISASTLSFRTSNARFGCAAWVAIKGVQTSTLQSVDSLVHRGNSIEIIGKIASGAHAAYQPGCTYNLTFSTSPGQAGALFFSVELGLCRAVNGQPFREVSMHFDSFEDEAFWGFGEQQDVINFKGRFLPLMNTEHGWGRAEYWAQLVNLGRAGCGGSWWTSYIGLPQYLSSENYSFFLTNSETTYFDLRQEMKTRVSVNGTKLSGGLVAASSPLDTLSAYTKAISGRMGRLPAWSQKGAVVHTRGGSEKVLKELQTMIKSNISVSALWIEDWTGGQQLGMFTPASTSWTLNNTLYPGWHQLRQEALTIADARIVGYVSGNFRKYPPEDAERDFYSEAESKGYLIKHCDGRTYKTYANAGADTALLDVSNPEARAWFQREIIQGQLVERAGFSGWMGDFGEWSPLDPSICLYSGEDPFVFHNKYAEIWNAMQTSWMQESDLDTKDLLPFVRSGRLRSPGATKLFWSGDQMVNFDVSNGMQGQVLAMLSVGLSGFSLTNGDIGGEGGYSLGAVHVPYFTRDKNTLLRWMELSAFSALYRTHLGNVIDANVQWNSDQGTLRHFARFSRLFEYLSTYRQQVIEQDVVGRGWPLMRLMLLHYPKDEVARGLKDQFLFGEHLLVAPVLSHEIYEYKPWLFGPSEYQYAKRDVYLPPGKWTRAWHETETYMSKGQTFHLKIPFGKPALFWRSSWSGGPELSAFLRRLDEDLPGYRGASTEPDRVQNTAAETFFYNTVMMPHVVASRFNPILKAVGRMIF